MFVRKFIILLVLIALSFSVMTCTNEVKPRLCMFVGLDISGSFIKTKYFDESIDFMAHYIYSHLNGLHGMEVPSALFVSSIGGAK